MLETEQQWRRASIFNYAVGAIGAVLVLGAQPISALTGVDETIGLGAGFLGAATALHLTLFRRRAKPSPTEREGLIENEPRYLWRMFWGLLVILASAPGLALAPDDSFWFWGFVGVVAITVVFLGVTSIGGLKLARASREDPSLHDERMQMIYDKSGAKAFQWMFTAALILGAVHLVGEVDMPLWLAIYAPPAIGALVQLHYMARHYEQ